MVDKDTNGKAKFHQIDPWHMMHLGVGKSWSASGLMLLQEQVDEPNQDLRIAVLSNEYKQFCKRAKLVAHIKKIDRYTLGGGGSNEPNGTWNKASVTSNMLLFLEDYCNRNSEILKGNQQLEIFAKGTQKINQFFRGIYSEGVFIAGPKGLTLSSALRDFIQTYVCEAALSHENGCNYFPLFPKLHFLHELSHQMRRQCQLANVCMNPASMSCSIDEDFIGRLATLTRCVSPRLCALRTLQRYLCHIQLAWAHK
ncbi:unnamed protein product [Durusdinium trenchii]|uniref:Uncharacterized protein n=1 Tax=Durusdinium trenchii TaxID=1381693 RepID=A0ABP0PGT0_9DINO